MSVTQIGSSDQFQEVIGQNKLIIVDFSADWCGPCQIISKTFDELAKSYTEIGFYKVDVDELRDLSKSQKIKGIPTFLFFKKGEKVFEIIGAHKEKIIEAINEIQEKK
ncbi:thioredoxin-like protein [Anaeramoeba flamelloides]|uniref:Thioredoxin n=1 Tax=Anaeramoeba flamelloides TaxID=1746091 RepID=A0AAV7YQC4_9EUKA|nr:thioredoxin-like protein [Anaeramoeba flamelloides]KAJ6234846.1 thioredoxin-like protein [Anaeramoeba flamelloides]